MGHLDVQDTKQPHPKSGCGATLVLTALGKLKPSDLQKWKRLIFSTVMKVEDRMQGMEEGKGR